MRPVVVPVNPPPNTYDEAEQSAVRVYKGHEKGMKRRWETWTKRTLLDYLISLIDPWADDGAPLTKHGTPQLDNLALQVDYSLAMDRLSAGGHDWGDARRALIEAIGQYCCYCGSPVFSHLHIEHVLPKSSFPDGIFDWSNFLLACASCNSAKSNDPNQSSVRGGPLSTADAIDVIRNVNNRTYLWPFYNWGSLPPNQVYPYSFRLCWIDWKSSGPRFTEEVDARTQQELAWQFRSGTLPENRGLYYLESGHHRREFFGVSVGVRTSDNLDSAANRIIRFASLNKIVGKTDSNKSIDRRILNRTSAWFRAQVVRDQLSTAVRANDPDLLNAVKDMARVTIRNTGYWPIWLQVLGDADIGGEPAQAFLQSIFPGTATVTWLLAR